MGNALEFDWDVENTRYLAAHKVTPAEFEQVMDNDPLELGYELIDAEERFRSIGLTNRGRLLLVVWTPRGGKIRAVTAFRASTSNKRDFSRAANEEKRSK